MNIVNRKWGILLFSGWVTATLGLLAATIAGTFVESQFSVVGNGKQVVHAIVMSVIVVPMIVYLYKRLYQQVKKPDKPAYAITLVPHIVTGFLFALVLGISGLLVMDALGLITIEEWHAPLTWISAFLLNMLIALFYEALPEELAMRGFIFDVLRHKLSIWQTVLVQAFIFLAFSAGVTLLQVLIGMASASSIVALLPELILHFFFAIALGLIRVWTGSLWASIGFHLGYLTMARFFLMPDFGGKPPIVTFQDNVVQGLGAGWSMMIIIPGTIILLLILLSIGGMLEKKR